MMAGSSAAVRTLVNSADLAAILASSPSGAVELKRTTSAPGRSRSAVSRSAATSASVNASRTSARSTISPSSRGRSSGIVRHRHARRP